MKRSVAVAVAAQAGILGLVALPSFAVRLTGTEYRLRVVPVDPIDPFRGAYVQLAYVGFESYEHDGEVFVTLRREGDTWVGDEIVEERPKEGPYVRCEADGGLKCGIESWFVSQRRARQAETDLADGGVARVRISGSGRAVLVRVED